MKSRHVLALAVAGALIVAAGWLGRGGIPALAEDAAAGADTPIAITEFSGKQQLEIEAMIKDYQMTHPDVIRDAMDELQRRQEAEAAAAQISAIEDNKDALFSSRRQVVLGNPNGDVTLVEFFDYNCTYCKRAHADMVKLIENDKNVKIVLKEFPVLGEGSVEAAQVAAAVNVLAPEKYGEFHDKLINERGQVNGARALAVATEIGLDKEAVKKEMTSDEVRATLQEAFDLGNKLSLSGTPSYVTPKEVVIGAVGYETLKQKLEEARCVTAANC
jgi:protein-disulfide isomerase